MIPPIMTIRLMIRATTPTRTPAGTTIPREFVTRRLLSASTVTVLDVTDSAGPFSNLNVEV